MTIKILEVVDLSEGGANVSLELEAEDEAAIKSYLNKNEDLTDEDISKFVNDALDYYINKNSP